MMSRVTGPNEGPVMWERGVFGILRWENLSNDGKRQAAADLAAAFAGGATDGEAMGILKAILEKKPPVMRDDIAVSLSIAGLTDHALRALGFGAAAGENGG